MANPNPRVPARSRAASAPQAQSRQGGGRAADRAGRKKSYDYSILFVTLLLVCIGIVLVYDASYYAASQSKLYNYDGMFFFKKQMFGAAVGLVLMLITMRIPYKKLEKFKTVGILAAIGLLACVWVPGLGTEANGATRWLNIAGISIQPAELAKFALVLYIAGFVAKDRKRIRSFKNGVLPILLVGGVIAGMVFLQPNLSTAASIGFLMLAMLFVAGANLGHLAVILTGAVGAIVAAVLLDKDGYRFKRYTAFLDPWADASDTGYQLVQSLYALGSGGLFGMGFGNSRQKYLYLPYRESDFIFSIVGEEFGLVGSILLLGIFIFLIWRGIRVALTCKDLFGSLLAAGITAVIAIQVIINVAVVTGSMPPTGVPLPFISAGGTSLMIFMAAIGILLNISRSTRSTP